MTDDRSLEQILLESKVLVCVGAGGVGKTSTAAAVAMHAAGLGKRVIVLTIDPARRLANALGLPEIGNEERRVEPASFERMDLPVPPGQLSAMMLDVKTSWDEVVMRYHPDPESRRKLLQNRLYFTMSTALAGSQEYMAMEKLYDLSTRENDPLDLIVLDTPPASNAVDFLDAPSKMFNALDNEATRWLLEPYSAAGRVTNRLFDAGSSFMIRTIGRFTGTETLEELAELLSHFQGMYDGFRTRAKAVRAILEDQQTSFWVVASPRPGPVEVARSFNERLLEDGINVRAIILNRGEPDPFGERAPAPERLRAEVEAQGGSAALAEKLISVADRGRAKVEAERALRDDLVRDTHTAQVVLVPELPADIHDLSGLDALRKHVFQAI